MVWLDANAPCASVLQDGIELGHIHSIPMTGNMIDAQVGKANMIEKDLRRTDRDNLIASVYPRQLIGQAAKSTLDTRIVKERHLLKRRDNWRCKPRCKREISQEREGGG